MRGARPLGRRGARRLTPYPSRGHGTQSTGGREALPNTRSGHRPPFDQRFGRSSLGPPCPKFLVWCWGHLIGSGRVDPGRGHGVVRLRRTSVIVGHAHSFSKVRSKGQFIDVLIGACLSFVF